jgi:hypothetical protein
MSTLLILCGFYSILNIYRIVPDSGDARERLIDALKSISKIFPSQYSAYKNACKKYASEFSRGMNFEY